MHLLLQHQLMSKLRFSDLGVLVENPGPRSKQGGVAGDTTP